MQNKEKEDKDTFGTNNEIWHVFWSAVFGGVSFLLGGAVLYFGIYGVVALIKIFI